MKVDVQSICSHFASLAWVALRSFLGTLFALTLAGILLAGLAYYFLYELHWIYGVIAAVVTLVESVMTGIVLGIKRATVMVVAQGLGSLRLGQSFVHFCFGRMSGVVEGMEHGERGERIARSLERLPLAQAERMLTGVVQDLTGTMQQGSWLRQKIQTRLLEAVRSCTLARFREEDAQHGGIDLLKVRDELERTVDDVLVQQVRRSLRYWLVLVIIGLPLVVASQTWVIYMLLHSKG
ncbi:MAG TPA: hypothetical protein VFA18_22365 [Gemmataceae bacterium]|nr:hypothetical protein [Gemmataceae bacterium]